MIDPLVCNFFRSHKVKNKKTNLRLLHYLQIEADAMLPRVNPVCSSSALHELVCVCGTALLPPSSSCARCWPRWAAAVGAAEFEGARTIGRAPLCGFAHSGSSEHRVRGDSVAPPLQRRKLQSFGARTGADISTEFPGCVSISALKQPPHAHAARAAAPCSSARRSRETRFSAR